MTDRETHKHSPSYPKTGNGHHESKKQAAAAESELPLEEVLQEVATGAEELLSDLKTQVEKTVKEYPLQSVAVCLGVGALLGALWASRR